MFEILSSFLKAQDEKTEVKTNYPISLISPIGIGAPAAYVIYPYTKEALIEILSFLRRFCLPYKIFGRMSNVLPRDEFYNGVIVRTDRMNDIRFRDNTLFAESGAMLGAIMARCVDAELSGVEELAGIPGSIGGSVVGNAGAFGREMSDVVTRAHVYDVENREEYIVSASDMNFSYRHSSIIPDKYVVLGVELTLVRDEKSSIVERMLKCRNRRLATQPIGERTLGSTFKRCRDRSAAELIDLCGLKGVSVGDAQISKKHAGFVVNNGEAKARDVLELIELAENKVRTAFGITLEREIILM